MIVYYLLSHKELEKTFDLGLRSLPDSIKELNFYSAGKSHHARERGESFLPGKTRYLARITINRDLLGELDSSIMNTAESFFTLQAEYLSLLNRAIIGSIEILEGYYESGFKGTVTPHWTTLKSAKEILMMLIQRCEYNAFDFYCDVLRNPKVIFCNYGFWKSLKEDDLEFVDRPTYPYLTIVEILDKVREIFSSNYPSISLPTLPAILDSELSE